MRYGVVREPNEKTLAAVRDSGCMYTIRLIVYQIRVDYRSIAPRIVASIAVKKADGKLSAGNAALLGVLPPPLVPLVAVTAAATEPKVGVGTAKLRSPSMALAVLDKLAKPTEGGVNRKTVYTFFKNVSPTIQGGVMLFVLSGSSKNAPRHWVEVTCSSLKSEGLTVQVFPPKAIVTVTSVSQG